MSYTFSRVVVVCEDSDELSQTLTKHQGEVTEIHTSDVRYVGMCWCDNSSCRVIFPCAVVIVEKDHGYQDRYTHTQILVIPFTQLYALNTKSTKDNSLYKKAETVDTQKATL